MATAERDIPARQKTSQSVHRPVRKPNEPTKID